MDKEKYKLSDNDLDKVAGGFKSWYQYSNGQRIECPYCGRDCEGDFDIIETDYSVKAEYFKCKGNHEFYVGADGYILP